MRPDFARIKATTGIVPLALQRDAAAFDHPHDGAERLAYLERDRWPEFERALWQRRPRRIHFTTSSFAAERQRWEWMVWRSRSWAEVERVLNRHHVDWERLDRWAIRAAEVTIYRQ